MKERVLVFGAHPDDGALGCGGTLARMRKEGRELFMCIVTSAYTPDWTEEYVGNQKKEVEASNKILGVKETRYLDFPAAKLDTVPQKVLNDTFFRLITEYKPHTIFIPHQGDLHRDHRIVYESALVAARPAAGAVRTILTFSTMESGFVIEANIPTVYVDITDTFDIKLQAIMAYKSEMRPYPHPRSPEVIRALAQKRGSEAGVRLAESFMLARHIVS